MDCAAKTDYHRTGAGKPAVVAYACSRRNAATHLGAFNRRGSPFYIAMDVRGIARALVLATSKVLIDAVIDRKLFARLARSEQFVFSHRPLTFQMRSHSSR